MKRFIIEEAVVKAEGITIGPSSGVVIGEIKVRDEDGKEFYLSDAEVDCGLENVYQTEMETAKFQIEYDLEDPEGWDTAKYGDFLDYIQTHMISGGEIEDILDEMADSDLLPLVNYLFYIVRAEWDDTKEFIEKTRGHWTDEFEVPELDDDDDYDYEDEEDGGDDGEEDEE